MPRGDGIGSPSTCPRVLFLNAVVDKDPSEWCVILVSKKGSVLSDSISTVNCIMVSMELRC